MTYRSDTHMRCPQCCSAALSPKTLLRVERFHCRQCHGFWFDLVGLSALGDQLGWAARLPLGVPTNDHNDRLCPQCHRALVTHAIIVEEEIQFFVDSCGNHGIWFDKEELEPTLRILMARDEPTGAQAQDSWWASLLRFLDREG